MSTPARLRRIQRGRNHSYTFNGEPIEGVTTILRNGIPKPALAAWQGNTVANYAVDHWDELAPLSTSERLDLLKGSPYAERNAAAGRGTEIHAIAQRLAAGEELDIPEPLIGHVDSYLAFTRDWQPRELLVEAPCANTGRWPYAGTLDLIAVLADGLTWLLDYKTSGKGVYPDTALQLAAYRNCDIYLDQAGVEQPMLPVDRAGVIWLRADGYDLIPLETGAEAFRAFLYAIQVARFTQAAREEYVGDALRAPGVAA